MRIKHKLLAVLALIALILAIALPAEADVGVINTGITNSLAAATGLTGNMGSAVKVDRNNGPLTVQISYGGGGNGTNTLKLYWLRSLDGTTFEMLSYAANTNTSVLCTNDPGVAKVQYVTLPADFIGSAHSIKIGAADNSTASGTAAAFTNVTVKVGLKKL